MFAFTRELAVFLLRRRKYWLMPIVVISALLGILLVFTEGSVIAPFIYTIF